MRDREGPVAVVRGRARSIRLATADRLSVAYVAGDDTGYGADASTNVNTMGRYAPLSGITAGHSPVKKRVRVPSFGPKKSPRPAAWGLFVVALRGRRATRSRTRSGSRALATDPGGPCHQGTRGHRGLVPGMGEVLGGAAFTAEEGAQQRGPGRAVRGRRRAQRAHAGFEAVAAPVAVAVGAQGGAGSPDFSRRPPLLSPQLRPGGSANKDPGRPGAERRGEYDWLLIITRSRWRSAPAMARVGSGARGLPRAVHHGQSPL
jgi:hypothetical protein